MKFMITVALLLSSLASIAETVSLNLPGSGRYIVTLSNQSSCMSGQFTIIPGQIGWSDKGTALLKATVAAIVETRGGAQWCDENQNIASGVFIAKEPMDIEINVDGSNGGITSPEIKIENISLR